MKKLMLVFLLFVGAAIASAQNGGDPKNGERLYVADGCWQCHNYNGSGNRQAPRLAQTKLTSQGFVSYIRKPRAMPAYSSKVLSDMDAADILAYIRTFPEPPAVNTIPILNNLD